MTATDLTYAIGFLFAGILMSLICNLLLLSFSQTLGIRNKNDVTVRWSNQSKPSLGGVSFFVVFVFSAIAIETVAMSGNIFHDKHYLGLFFAGGLAFVMGLADDAYNTKPLIKLAAQIFCGIVLVYTDTIIDLFHIPALDAIFTLVWVVLIMNSLNMLDNMDGITGTTVLFILLSAFFGGIVMHGWEMDLWSLTLLSMIGGVIGFLRYNVHPSRLFMGDAGSQFIGLFVAFVAVHNLWNAPSEVNMPSWSAIVLVLITFTPAAVDTLTVVINRLKKGKSPMVGGKDHTTHHLVYSGKSDFQVWMVFVVVGAISFALSLLIIWHIKGGVVWPLPMFLIFFLVVFYFLYRNTLRYPEKK